MNVRTITFEIESRPNYTNYLQISPVNGQDFNIKRYVFEMGLEDCIVLSDRGNHLIILIIQS